MHKDIRLMSAALFSVCILAVPSCGRKDPVSVPSTTPAATTAAASAQVNESGSQTSAQPEEPLAPVFAYKGQLETIIKAKSTWYVEGDDEMNYAITDLDMNGRYEITAAKKNKSFAMFEVKADGSGIDKVKTPFESGSPGPYIEDVYALRMNSDGDYLYVAREYEETSGSDEVTCYYYVMSLSNGKLRANQVATEIRYTDEAGNVSVRYGDDEFEMSKEDFKNKTDTGLPKIEYKLKVSWGDGKAVSGMKDANALESICFKLVK